MKRPEHSPPSGSTHIWSSGDAIERAGSTDREAIAKAVRQTKDFPAVTGIITIDENGDAIKSVAIVKIENGKFVYDTTINP